MQRDGLLRLGPVSQFHLTEFRQPLRSGFIEREFALIDQDHDRRGVDRFGHRGDPEQGVLVHLPGLRDIGHADGGVMNNPALLHDKRDDPCGLFGRDRLLHGCGDGIEPGLIKGQRERWQEEESEEMLQGHLHSTPATTAVLHHSTVSTLDAHAMPVTAHDRLLPGCSLFGF